MHAGLLSEAKNGWDGASSAAAIGTPNWMAWRAGKALKDAERGRPIGIMAPRLLAGLPGQSPKGIYLDILPEGSPSWSCIFAFKDGAWVLENLTFSKTAPPLRARLAFWLQRTGWAWG